MSTAHLALIGVSLGLLLVSFLGRLKKDLSHLVYIFYLLRSFFMFLPLSLYFLVLFLYSIAPSFERNLTADDTDNLIAALRYFGAACAFLICGVFLFLSAFSVLGQRIRLGMRRAEVGDTRLRLESSLLQSRMGIFLNVGLLLTLPVPVLLLQLDRFLHGRYTVNLPGLLYAVSLLMLVTSIWGLHTNRHLMNREKALYNNFLTDSPAARQ